MLPVHTAIDQRRVANFCLPPLFRGRLVGVRTACRTLSLPSLLGASSPTRVCTCMVPVCLLALRPFHDDFPGLLPTTGSDGPDSRLYDSGEALELPSVFFVRIYTLYPVRASIGGDLGRHTPISSPTSFLFRSFGVLPMCLEPPRADFRIQHRSLHQIRYV